MKPSTNTIFSKSTQKLIFATILLVVSIFLYGYLFSHVISLTKSNSVLATEVRRIEDQESKITILKRAVLSTEESRKILTSYFIDSKDIVPFLEKVEEYGRDTSVSVKFINVDIAKSPKRLNLMLNAEGQFTNLYRFLALLESVPFEVVFNTFDIKALPSEVPTGVGKQSLPVNWEATVNLSVLSITGVE